MQEVHDRAWQVEWLVYSPHAPCAPCRAALLSAQVLLLSDYGLSAPTPRPRPLQPLKLPDPDPLLTHLAAESAAYWGGLQQLTGAPLLAGQQSLDVLLDPERDHAGATGFSKLQVCVGLSVCALYGPPTEEEGSSTTACLTKHCRSAWHTCVSPCP